MPLKSKKIGLIYFVIASLLMVGLVPLVLTGWFLSERSGKELRAVENRYQTQLVQEKANQIEMFGQRYGDLVGSYAKALELSNDFSLLSSPETEQKLSITLKENPNLIALFIKPTQGESLSIFRAENISKEEIEKISNEIVAKLENKKSAIGKPQKIKSSGETVLTFASPVIIENNVSAAVIGVVSMREISEIMGNVKVIDEEKLWNDGLPIVFVVDGEGHAVSYPDLSVAVNRKPLNNLKIVQEWLETNRQIKSGLLPFTAEFKGGEHKMIGAYSTASLNDLNLGVIVMQDEKKALASVGEMRLQTWIISLAFAFVALILGFILSKYLTAPLIKLASAAQKIAAGDFSSRVDTKNITEIGTLGNTFNMMSEKVESQIIQLAKSAEENRELFVGTVKALAAAIDGKDKYTRGHSERVARISVAIGKRLGMGEEELETLRMSALLHDIGKIAIDDAILKKPAALTDEEFEIMKTHPQRGYKIMSQIPAMKEFLPGMYMHHEMVNGKGYPQGLKGEDIPLQAKIVSVADTFDAMTIDRPYSKGMTLQASLDRIRSFVGTRYDGKVVEALVQACNDGQVGIGIIRLKENMPNNVNLREAQMEQKVVA